MLAVRKNDGSLETFNKFKIIESIRKETGCEGKIIEQVVDEVEHILQSSPLQIITGPLIREVVNSKFLEHELFDCRKKYTRVGMPVYDARRIDTGSGKGDNANLQDSPETGHKRKADQLSKEQYLLMFPDHITEAHLNGDIHIHDLEYFGSRQFCLDSDLRYFFYYGFVGDGTGDHTSFAAPAKRPEVAVLHAVKVLGSSQTNCAGGQGFYNFLTFLAPYFKDCNYDTYRQCMQLFVYEMTQMLVARGGQVVFSSVQLSPGIPELWKDIPAVYKGKIWDGQDAPLQTYGMFEKENRLLFKSLMEVMLEGDYKGKPFYFPKPEISIEPQFIKMMKVEDEIAFPDDYPSIRELYLLSFKLASKFGTPYFDNQIPQYRGAGKGISCFQCCAYCFSSNEESDDSFIDKLYFKDGAHFSMGSYQVMTVNFPRLAYEAVDATDDERARETYFEGLAKMRINLCCEVFKLKREMLKDVKAPFLQQSHNGSPHLVDFDSLVYTVGVIGINEVCEILYGKQLHESQETQVKAMLFVMKMKQYCAEKSKEHGFTIAFARTPAETTAQRFAVLDLLNYGNAHKFVKGDVKGAIRKYAETGSRDLPIYYTNGTHVPVDAGIPLAEKIRIEQAFFPILDGGNICNIYLGEQKPDPRGLMDMTLKICESTNLGYFAFTRDFTVCNNGYRQY